jgi:hypothetical protein
MPDIYARTFVGVKDGTKTPADRADGRLVGAKQSMIVAPKVAGQAIAAGDQFFIGTLRAGESLRDIRINTDTSLGTTTFSVGPKATPAKYRPAATFTTPLNVPTSVGPIASQAILDPLTADEDIWATFAVAGIAGSVVLAFEMDVISIK